MAITPERDKLYAFRILLQLHNVAFALFLFAFNSLLHFGATDFLDILPLSLFCKFGSYALHTAIMLTMGVFSLLAFWHQRRQIRKTPSLFVEVKCYAQQMRSILIVFAIALFTLALYYQLEGGFVWGSWKTHLKIGLSYVTLLCGYGLTQFACKTQSRFLARKIALILTISIASFCTLGVFLYFFYASPKLMRAIRGDLRKQEFYRDTDQHINDAYRILKKWRNVKHLPDDYGAIIMLNHMGGKEPTSYYYGGHKGYTSPTFRYKKLDDTSCEVCINFATTTKQRIRYIIRNKGIRSKLVPETLRLQKGENCKTISVADSDIGGENHDANTP